MCRRQSQKRKYTRMSIPPFCPILGDCYKGNGTYLLSTTTGKVTERTADFVAKHARDLAVGVHIIEEPPVGVEKILIGFNSTNFIFKDI
ncbi:hypothetical protein DITRI_Ditri20bG0139000 [Diplodiscus trichospermus]